MPRIILFPLLYMLISISACSQESNTASSTDANLNPKQNEPMPVELNENEEPVMETKTSSKTLILVTGITGRQGGAVARQLLERGYKLRGFTRDRSKPKALTLSKMGVDMQEGNFSDSDTIRKAIDGVYGIFLNTPPVPNQVVMGKSVIDAASSANIQHFVYSSYLAADPVHGIPALPKAAVERYLRESGLPYTILRPVTFMENFNWAEVKTRIQANGISDPRQADSIRQYISVEDIAHFTAEAFDDPEAWKGRALNIAGDEFTGTELAEIFSSVTGKQINYVTVDWTEWGSHAPPGLAEMYQWYERTDFRADILALRKQYPGLRRLESFLRKSGWEN